MTTQQRLDQALAARHALATGQSKSAVMIGERRVEYTAAKAGDLDRYIAQLRAQLAGRRPSRARVQYVVID